jgi:hypothetical protein
MQRSRRIFWQGAFASLLTVSASLQANGQSARSSTTNGTQVYLLRGLANLSPGFDGLAEMIRKHGIFVAVHNHLAGSTLISDIERNYRRGRRRIVLIGHSLGASAVVDMAEQLGEDGLPVSLLVTVDPVTRLSMPKNVQRQLNLYASDGIGTSATRSGGAKGALVNRDFKGRSEIGHFSITTSPRVQREILRSVLAVAG